MTAKVSDFVSLQMMKQNTACLTFSYHKSDEITHLNGKGDTTKSRYIAKREKTHHKQELRKKFGGRVENTRTRRVTVAHYFIPLEAIYKILVAVHVVTFKY